MDSIRRLIDEFQSQFQLRLSLNFDKDFSESNIGMSWRNQLMEASLIGAAVG
jgi:hypothetical protein